VQEGYKYMYAEQSLVTVGMGCCIQRFRIEFLLRAGIVAADWCWRRLAGLVCAELLLQVWERGSGFSVQRAGQ
jgi:hypothetical protein